MLDTKKFEHLNRLLQLAPMGVDERSAWALLLPYMEDAQADKLIKVLESDTSKMADLLVNNK